MECDAIHGKATDILQATKLTFTFIFIKAFPKQQINQELVPFWKSEVVTMFTKSNNMLHKVKKMQKIQC